MVFGLFSRKTAVLVKPEATTSNNSHPVQQLRTPSPSIASNGNPNQSPQFSFVRSPLESSLSPPAPADSSALHSLLLTIPPKVLHEYCLAQLDPNPSPTTPVRPQPYEPLSDLTASVLTQFFSTLQPPPLQHCTRCHKGFFDVENNDRSCTVGHDDESAEVERVGRGDARTQRAGEYETLWGCCGRTVEGDGDMGPPDGWCYEGMHTTDVKRARFRADSTLHDDKLASCSRLRCHPPVHTERALSASGSTRSTKRYTRKRSRRSLREEESEESAIDSDQENQAPSKEIGKRKANIEDEDTLMAHVLTSESPEPESKADSVTPPSPKPKPKPRPRARTPAVKKPTSTAMSTRATSATPKKLSSRKSVLSHKLSMSEVPDSEDEKPRKRRKVST